jgi:hypothetical protein
MEVGRKCEERDRGKEGEGGSLSHLTEGTVSQGCVKKNSILRHSET